MRLKQLAIAFQTRHMGIEEDIEYLGGAIACQTQNATRAILTFQENCHQATDINTLDETG